MVSHVLPWCHTYCHGATQYHTYGNHGHGTTRTAMAPLLFPLPPHFFPYHTISLITLISFATLIAMVPWSEVCSARVTSLLLLLLLLIAMVVFCPAGMRFPLTRAHTPDARCLQVVSHDARDFVKRLLTKDPASRGDAVQVSSLATHAPAPPHPGRLATYSPAPPHLGRLATYAMHLPPRIQVGWPHMHLLPRT